MKTDEINKVIKELAESVESHPVLSNNFLRRWQSERLTVIELSVLVRQYGAWIQHFPKALAQLIQNSTSEVERSEHESTLRSELGNGDGTKAHWRLFDHFFNVLAEKLNEKGKLERPYLVKTQAIHQSTQELIDEEIKLYGDSDRALAAGAQLANELQAFHMLNSLYEGARNYAESFGGTAPFHMHSEYFLIHLVEEKDHMRESVAAAIAVVKSEQDLSSLRKGFMTHLNLIAGMWQEIEETICRLRAAA